ncbi:MAG: ATPase, partial [Proteobacteria bacterium]|nr:ATPase [Pseudomonadota bacterium]
GSSHAKAAVVGESGEVVGAAVRRSGTDFAEAAEAVLAEALAEAGMDRVALGPVFATGYGRRNVTFAVDTRTEIACHGLGCYHYFPGRALTVIDIGGQDNKVIKLDEAGRRVSFKMNRKCAAGTGAFLEEMAVRLDLDLESLNGRAEVAEEEVILGSFCTVFTATEVLEKIRAGHRVRHIVKGLFRSVIKRVLEMDSLSEKVVMTGGVVEHNPFLATMMAETIGREVLLPPHPQITGALGAALLAREAG